MTGIAHRVKLRATLESSNPWANIGVLVGALLLVRLLFLAVLPEMSTSIDLRSWVYISNMLTHGRNPYLELHSLNWPPFWLMNLSLFGHVAQWTGMSVETMVRALLITCEAVVVAMTYLILAQLGIKNRMRILVYGMVLNPVCFYLVCVHGNFDVIMMMFVLLFLDSLMRVSGTRDTQHWLLACLWLGLAVFCKTVPLILVPLLFQHLERTRGIERLVGAFLVLMPTAVGVGTLLSLFPDPIRHDVLAYQSQSSLFGITAIIWLLNPGVLLQDHHLNPAIATAVGRAFVVVVLLLLAAEISHFRRARLDTPDGPRGTSNLAVIALVNLLFVAVFGPGFATQYAYWFVPLGCIVYALGFARPSIVVTWVILVVAYTWIYGFFPTTDSSS